MVARWAYIVLTVLSLHLVTRSALAEKTIEQPTSVSAPAQTTKDATESWGPYEHLSVVEISNGHLYLKSPSYTVCSAGGFLALDMTSGTEWIEYYTAAMMANAKNKRVSLRINSCNNSTYVPAIGIRLNGQ